MAEEQILLRSANAPLGSLLGFPATALHAPTLALSPKGSGCNLDIVAWLTP
jgi:hypothetical protein